ncbi:MAG: AAA family ATPase, partial [Myxococcales bacterium]|nr:AAA family ATPase [Myxococcales bacterium]
MGEGTKLLRAVLIDPPMSAGALRPKLPPLLSALVMKLLEKRPNQRYQQAESLVEDLHRLKRLLDQGRDGDGREAFELARGDRGTATPGRGAHRQLQGRERERSILLSEVERSSGGSAPRLLLISGGPGIGKSSLEDELVDEVVRRGGRLGRGRCDTLRSPLPYMAWLAALDDVLLQLRSEPARERHEWSRRIVARVGALVPVLRPLLSQLELLLSHSPPSSSETGDAEIQAILNAPLPELQPHEAQNRLRLAFARLLAALSVGGPLVLMLDDFHGADDGSLDLLSALLEGSDLGQLLLVVNYRSDELHEDHRLLEFVSRVRDRSVAGRHLELAPLTDAGVGALLAAELGWSDEDFTRVIIHSSGGNPLLVHEYLAALVTAGLLRPETGGWHWNEEELTTAELPKTLAGLLRLHLTQLGHERRELLRRAACLDPEFSLGELAVATQRSPRSLLAEVQALCRAGLLRERGLKYGFVVDGVREYAYAELGVRDRRDIRSRLGQLHLRRSRESGSDLVGAA